MLLRLAYLAVTNAFAVLRLLPMSDRNKDAEILALRCACRVFHPCWSGGMPILMEGAAKTLVSAYVQVGDAVRVR